MNRLAGPHTNAREPLTKLREVHQQMLSAMDEIDEIVRERTFDDGRLSKTRWVLGQLRREGRVLVEQMLANLPDEVRTTQAPEIQHVRDCATAALLATARHSNQWHLNSIRRDRAAYQSATSHIRELWVRTIHAEQQLFYALLGNKAHAA